MVSSSLGLQGWCQVEFEATGMACSWGWGWHRRLKSQGWREAEVEATGMASSKVWGYRDGVEMRLSLTPTTEESGMAWSRGWGCLSTGVSVAPNHHACALAVHRCSVWLGREGVGPVRTDQPRNICFFKLRVKHKPTTTTTTHTHTNVNTEP